MGASIIVRITLREYIKAVTLNRALSFVSLWFFGSSSVCPFYRWANMRVGWCLHTAALIPLSSLYTILCIVYAVHILSLCDPLLVLCFCALSYVLDSGIRIRSINWLVVACWSELILHGQADQFSSKVYVLLCLSDSI